MGGTANGGGFAGTARLVREDDGTEFPLSGARLVAGRSAECDVVLPDTAVSRRHALFERTGGVWRVSDLGSRTGIEVDGVRVSSPAPLRVGSTVRIGRLHLRFEETAASAAPEPAPVPVPSAEPSRVAEPTAPPAPVAPSPAEPPDPLVGTRLGEIDIRKLIGVGAAGRVYHGFQARLGRDVAVKVLAPELAKDPERVKSFIKEARAAARLVHPGTVTVFDAGEDRGHPWFSMELMDAGALDVRMASLPGGRIPWKEAFPALQSSAHGLAYLHREGFIHRDLKPGNLLAKTTGEVKIADLGIALHVFEAATAARKGTARYAAPEILRGAAPSAASDLYSLGATFHHILTGKPLFEGSDRNELLRRTAEGHRPRVHQRAPDVPPWLASIVDRLTSAKPEERFASADELAAALDEKDVRRKARAMGLSVAPVEHVERAPAEKADRRPAIAVGVALALAALLWSFRGALLGMDEDTGASSSDANSDGSGEKAPPPPRDPNDFSTPEVLVRDAIERGDALIAARRHVEALDEMLAWIRDHERAATHEEDVSPAGLDLCRRWVRARAVAHRAAVMSALASDQAKLAAAVRTGLAARDEGLLRPDIGAVLEASARADAVAKAIPGLRSGAVARRATLLAERLRRVASTWKRLVRALGEEPLHGPFDEVKGLPGQPSADVFRVAVPPRPHEGGIAFERADDRLADRVSLSWNDLGAQALAELLVVPRASRLSPSFRADLVELFSEASCVDGATGCFTDLDDGERTRHARAELEAIRSFRDLSGLPADTPGLAERMARWRDTHRRTDAFLRLVRNPAQVKELSLTDAELAVYFGEE